MQGVIKEAVKDVVASAAAGVTAGLMIEGFTGDREVATQTVALTFAVFASLDVIGRNVIAPVGTYLHGKLATYSEHPYYQAALTVGSEALKVVSAVAAAVPGIVATKMLVEPKQDAEGIVETAQTLVPFFGGILAAKAIGEHIGTTPEARKYNAMRAEILATIGGIEAMGYVYGNQAEVLPAGTAFAMAGIAKSVVRDAIDPALGVAEVAAATTFMAAARGYGAARDGVIAAGEGIANTVTGFYHALTHRDEAAAGAGTQPLMAGEGDAVVEIGSLNSAG